MKKATTTMIAARDQKLSPATSSREITMISAERIRSVRMAPEMRVFSVSAGLPAATFSSASSSWCPWPGPNFSQIFSAPS